jgi:ABC-2 type transport system permease protein
MSMTDEKTPKLDKNPAPEIGAVKDKPSVRTRPKRGGMNVKRVFSHSLWIAHKDLLEFSRNRVMLVMLFIFPLFLMIMTGYIFPTGSSLQEMPVTIINEDNFNNTGHAGTESIMLITTMKAINNHSKFFTFKSLSTEAKARESIKRGDQMGAVIIPANFTESILSKNQGQVTILYDQSKTSISLQLTSLLNAVIDEIGNQKAIMTVNKTTGYSIQQSKAVVTPYKVQSTGTVPGKPNYFTFLAPGIMMMVVMFGVMNGLPRAIAYEKDSGTLDGVLAAPTSRFSIILGKVIAQSVRGFIQGFIVLLLAMLLFGVVVTGNILLVVFLLALGIFSFIGLGIVITSAASDEETAATFMMVLQFPMMFLSGVFFPIEQMPWYMQAVSKALPLTYSAQAMRKVIVLGAGIQDIIPEVLIMLVFGVVLLAIAIPLFKRAMTR